MCAFRIASLFSRNIAAKNPEPTGKISIRNKNPVEEKRTAASAHINSQFDSEATKNIKDNVNARPSIKLSGADSAKSSIPFCDNTIDEKLSGINSKISVTDDARKKRQIQHKFQIQLGRV